MFNFSVNRIKPNMEGKVGLYRARMIIGILMSVCGFIMFGLGGYLSSINLGFIAVALCGFFMVPGGVILGTTSAVRRSECMAISAALEQIRQEDKILVARLFPNVAELQAEMICEKLISSGNLKGYKLVGGILLVKEELSVSEEQATNILTDYRTSRGLYVNAAAPVPSPEVATYTEPASPTYYCSSCGAALPDGATFCPGCGSKIEG